MTTSRHVYCMLTFCHNMKQWEIIKKIKIVSHYVNSTVEQYGNVFVHKDGTFRSINIMPKCTRLHQIASQISNFFLGWQDLTPSRRPYNLYCVGGDVKPCSINLTPIPGRGTLPPQTPPPLGASRLDSRTRGLRPLDRPTDSFILPETKGWIKPRCVFSHV